MKYICSTLIIAISLVATSCKTPDPGLVMSDLSEMIDKEVLVTTSHPVALSVIYQPGKASGSYDTASYFHAKLKSVDPSGLVLNIDDRKIWIGRESIVAVVVSD